CLPPRGDAAGPQPPGSVLVFIVESRVLRQAARVASADSRGLLQPSGDGLRRRLGYGAAARRAGAVSAHAARVLRSGEQDLGPEPGLRSAFRFGEECIRVEAGPAAACHAARRVAEPAESGRRAVLHPDTLTVRRREASNLALLRPEQR